MGGFQFLEVRSSLPDELLMYGDKLSMAHSLEIRVPYLDREIVEFAECLPAEYKIRWGSRKWLHRQVCRNFLPEKIIKRKKRGFATNVVDDWFRSSFSSQINDMINDDGALMYHYLAPESVRALLQEHRTKQSNNYKILFSLIVFETWLRQQSFQ
jgi:asparagine synthase (glutamine-hydrolysing)